MLFYYFLGGGACGCLITALLSRLCQRLLAQRRIPEPHCDHHACNAQQQHPHTVRVVRIAYYLPTSSGFSSTEQKHLAFLRHLIASGRVSEEI